MRITSYVRPCRSFCDICNMHRLIFAKRLSAAHHEIELTDWVLGSKGRRQGRRAVCGE